MDRLDKIAEFLAVGSGYGSGDGIGSGSGDGIGYGYGYGDSYGDVYGDGYGYGDGDGCGSGYGYSYGSGDGSGDGLETFCGDSVHYIDGVPTVIYSVHGNVAHGYIIGNDLTTQPCYVVKQGSLFAHGRNLHEAMGALRDKLFEDMSEEERIAAFIEQYPTLDTVCSNRDLYDWHHKLTGSCDMGRKQFQIERGLSLDDSITVKEFIKLTKDAYGGSVIQSLHNAYMEMSETMHEAET